MDDRKWFVSHLRMSSYVPGVSENLAVQIISESGASLESFDEDRKYAAWAGVAPGNNESAKKKEELRLEREIRR